MRAIEYLSPPAQVSMGDRWFDISPIGHFWVRRRFEIFRTLAGSVLQNSKHIAEIGCGHGLVQRQIEEDYGKEVTGFDLNEIALKQNQSQRSSVCCYDICQRAPQFRHRFDCVVMFDVLEHIDDEDRFLQAVMFHLAPGGYLVVNVPAGQWAVFRVRSGGWTQAEVLDRQLGSRSSATGTPSFVRPTGACR